MATQLHKISWPALTSGNFGQGLVAAFKNIDSNFQKLASLGLTTGESGTPAVWVPYNLNSVYCRLSGDDFASDYLNESIISDIRKSFENYNQITGFDQSRYIEECRVLYKQLINDLPGEKSSVQSANQTTWTHKWELIGNGYIFDNLTGYKDTLKNYIGYTDESGKYNEGQYLSFLPGDILVAGNYDSESGVFTKLSTTAHIYIDPRFRNPLTIAGDVNTEELSKMTDYSCVLYGALDGDVFKFKYVYAFPRIHCNSEGDFYLSVNGIDTNIPLTGRAGDSGKDAQFAVVQIAESVNIEDLNEIIYDTSENVGRAFEIGKKIDGDLGDPSLLNGCPAIIFPPTTYTINAYTTLYWVGYLKYNAGKLTAYCGRENLIKFDLDGHLFGGMMMGLDMYEKSIARPAGSTPWVKPRGLMLPIGSRYIGADGQGYWDPGVDQVGETTDFAAHLIYSKKPDSSSLKTNLHIGSIKDYRLIGLPNDPSGPDPVTLVKQNKVGDTNLFIDEPVTITNYGDDKASNETLLNVLGSSHIHSNGWVGSDLLVGGNLSVNWGLTVGQENEAKSGTVRANKYIKLGSQSGQILMGNGTATSQNPIRITNSALGDSAPVVQFKLQDYEDASQNPKDNASYFLGDISELIPKMTLEKSSYSKDYNGDTYDFNLTHLLYGGARALAILHVDITFGGGVGVSLPGTYENEVKIIVALTSDVLNNFQSPPYKIWNFIGSTDGHGQVNDNDAQMGIWFSLGTDGKLRVERCNHPGRLGGNTFGMDFVYMFEKAPASQTKYYVVNKIPQVSDSITLTGKTAFDSLEAAQASGQTGYIIAVTQKPEGGTVQFPGAIEMGNLGENTSVEVQQITYTHYWKLNNAPAPKTELRINNDQYNPDSVNPDWYDNKIWYLVKAVCTEPVQSDVVFTYNDLEGTAGVIQWDCSIQLPSAVTYKWHQGKKEFDEIGKTLTGDTIYSDVIKTYLTNTLLLYKDECAGEWKGRLASLIRSQSERYERFAGPHGVVSASHYLKGATWTTEITIEAWSNDLSDMIYIPGHKLTFTNNNQLTIKSISSTSTGEGVH